MSEKVSEKNQIPYPLQADDVVYIIRGSISYKGVIGDLFRGYMKFVPGYIGYIILPATGNVNPNIVEENDILIGKGAYNNGKYSMLRALKDEPALNEDFAIGLNSEEF